MKRHVIKGVAGMESLAKKLERFSLITSHDSDEEKEAWTLAHALMDIEEGMRVILDEHLPKLVNDDLTELEIQNLLWEIGDEFRHIFYHMRDPKIYRENFEDIIHDR